MSTYRRPRVPRATIFVTVAVAERGPDTLPRHAEALRVAIRQTRVERPFMIEAAVKVADHLHMIWTLTAGDSDFPNRWRVIKARFTQAVPDAERQRASHRTRRERNLVANPFEWRLSSIHGDGVNETA